MTFLSVLSSFGTSSTTPAPAEETQPSTSIFSSLFPTAHAEEGDDQEGGDEDDGDEEGGDDEEEEEEEEEEESADPFPEIYEQCQNSAPCGESRHHFDECQERVTGGHGFEGEDCIEELYVHAPRDGDQANPCSCMYRRRPVYPRIF